VVTSHSYWRAWDEVQSSLGRVRVKQAREKKEICMQNRDNFYMQILGSKGES
jgi:hypothetical protein